MQNYFIALGDELFSPPSAISGAYVPGCMFCHKNHFRDPDHRQKAPAFQSAKRYVTGCSARSRSGSGTVSCLASAAILSAFRPGTIRVSQCTVRPRPAFWLWHPAKYCPCRTVLLLFPFPILHKLYRNLPGVFQEHLLSDLQQEECSRICGTPGKKKRKIPLPGISSRNRRYALPIRKPDSI